MSLDHTLVVDIGKSNARVLVLDADGTVAGQSVRANASAPGPGYTALGVGMLQSWLLEAVPRLPSRERVGRVIVSTHGAAFCAVDDRGLVLPPIDYEWDGYGDHRATFEQGLDPFDHTGSPNLPMGLNAGLQLHWVKSARPDDWARIRHWLPYPQYWAWWLCGVAASEVSSLGCHTQLWSPAEGRFSRWAERSGIAERFAPVRPAWEVMGPLTPAMADRLGLPAACEVVCGVHDSNACLARYLDTPGATLLTTGTWTIAMATGGGAVDLAPARDELVNVAVDGRAVSTARFMGGREFEVLCAGAPASAATEDALAEVVHAGWQALPAFSDAGGPWRGRQGSVTKHGAAMNLADVPAALRPALAAWYCAVVSHDRVRALGDRGPVIVEGPLARNAAFTTALSALLGDGRPLQRSTDALEGTARGAARLARWEDRHTQAPALDTLTAADAGLSGALRRHADDWSARQARST